MRILLIQPRREGGMGFKGLSLTEPLGLESVAGALEEHEICIADLMEIEEVLQLAKEFRPAMCGISCSFTVDAKISKEIAKRLKEESQDLFLFIGGHHASAHPHDFYIQDIDCIIRGEGEQTTKEMVKAYEKGEDLKEVKGLIINGRERQIETPKRPLVKDLDLLPLPNRDLVKQYRPKYYHGFQKPVYTMETARGCPHRCRFCSVWRFYEGEYRMKSAERVIQEIFSIPGKYIFITDDNFFTMINRAKEVALGLEAKGIHKYFTIQARSDDINANRDLIRLWRRVGLSAVFIGFEQIDQEGLNNLEKKNSLKNNEEALAFLQKEKISVTASFIIDPAYSSNDFKRMLEYIRRLKIKIPSYSILTPLPGTRLYEDLKDRLITENHELFDLLHTVLPTELPLKKFYEEYSNLYARTYSYRRLLQMGLGHVCRHILFQVGALPHLIELKRGAWRFFNPESFLADHKE